MKQWNILRRFLRYTATVAAVGFVILIVCNVYVLWSTKDLITDEIQNLEPAETVIVLGAGVSTNGKLSPIFQDRVDTALLVYQAGKARQILVTGDNSTMSYNEVVPVRDYLLEQGVPAQNIFLDYAGFNTYDSLYRARDVFLVKTAIIVTQTFHLPRAVYIGNALNIQIVGYASDITTMSYTNHIREMLARVKSVIEVLAQRKPKFLGDTIPITGDGRETIE